MHSPIDISQLADSHIHDNELQELLAKPSTNSLVLKSFYADNSPLPFYCEVSTIHPGTRATLALIKQRFILPSVNRNIALRTKTSLQSQRCKISLCPSH